MDKRSFFLLAVAAAGIMLSGCASAKSREMDRAAILAVSDHQRGVLPIDARDSNGVPLE